MDTTFATNSLREAFSFPFQSKDWAGRFLIGVALLFASFILPVIPALFVIGYVAEVMRRTIQDENPSLPEWNNWGRYGGDGLRCFIVQLVYFGPGILVILAGWIAYMVVYLGGLAWIVSEPSQEVAVGQSFALIFGSMGILFISLFVGSLLMLIGGIPLPAALAHFIANDQLRSAFRIREIVRIIRADRWGYFAS